MVDGAPEAVQYHGKTSLAGTVKVMLRLSTLQVCILACRCADRTWRPGKTGIELFGDTE
jgi:hypothetical protein